MTAQAPYESPVSDAMVEAALSAPCGAYSVSSFIPLKSPHNIRELMRAALTAALAALPERAPVSAGGDAVALGEGDFYGNGSDLPKLHDDPAINAEIVIAALCARLDVARQALADAAAMQVVQPALARIKQNAAWAMGETNPGRVLPRSALYATPAPPVGADWVVVPREVVTFLNGETALEGLWFGEYPMTGGRPSTYWWRKYLTDALATPATVDVKHPQYEAGFKAGMRFEAKHRFFPDGATPAEARGVGDGVTELVAKWRKQVRTILGQGPSGAAMLQCAADLEAALAANKPDTRQAQAQGSEAVMVPREFIASLRDSFEAINNDDDGEIYMNESCDAMDRIDELLAAHAQAGEGSNGD